MKYQVLGHKRRLQKGDRPYDVKGNFNDLQQLFYMMDKVDSRLYDEVLVIDTETNKLVASRELEEPLTRKLYKRRDKNE
jgi:hypothetical protein